MCNMSDKVYYDYYAYLEKVRNVTFPGAENEDNSTSTKNKKKVNKLDNKLNINNYFLPKEYEVDFSKLPKQNWIGFEIDFELLTPWFSKDERNFYYIDDEKKEFYYQDNPIQKDCLSNRPFMSASSWKGLLRWSARMQSGLLEHLKNNEMKMDNWRDHDWIVHFFGNERERKDYYTVGNLLFFPTFFDKIGHIESIEYVVINPHKRRTKAGTQPIYYEVVPKGSKGILRFLYAPMNSEKLSINYFDNLFGALNCLLTEFGFSAKSNVGWGSAKIERYKIFIPDTDPLQADTCSKFKEIVHSLLK